MNKKEKENADIKNDSKQKIFDVEKSSFSDKNNISSEKKDVKKDKDDILVEKDDKVLDNMSDVFKKKKIEEKQIPNINNLKFKPYLGYSVRIVVSALLFVALFSLSYFFVRKSFVSTQTTTTAYQELGNVDYRVSLKENDFYESKYLSKGMVYITSLINTVDIDFDYRFIIDDTVDGNFNNSVVAKLVISNDSGDNVYYSKEYVLSPNKTEVINKNNSYSTKKSISIDYAYYNNISNKFKSTYGIDSSSRLIVSYKVGSNIASKEINSSNEMSVTIPLSQRSINISDSGGINNSRTSTVESKFELKHKIFIVFAVVLFITSVACLLKFLELIFAMFEKQSEYDKYISKIFKEYDRLIVEIKSQPNFDNKNVIKIDKFEELLDARDTLKQPIIYFDVTSHVKSYFYIAKGKDVYLLVIKAVDLEAEHEKKNKKNK